MQRISSITTVLRPNLETNTAFQVAWTVLRVVVGTVMIHNGLDKLSNIESFAQAYVEYIGLPFPIFFSYVAGLTELIGASVLIIGFLTRPAAFGLFCTMLVAMYHHILVAGFNIPYLELSAIYASCFFFFVINGAGEYSLDNLLAGIINKKALSAQTKQRTALEKSFNSSKSSEDGKEAIGVE